MKTRVLSAIVMILIAFPLLIIGGEEFSVFMALLAVLGLYELIHIRESVRKFPFLIKVFAYLLVIFLAMNNFDSIEFVCNLDYRVMSFVIFAFLASMIFIKDREKYNSSYALFLIGSVLFVGLSFNLMIITRNYDIKYVIYLLQNISYHTDFNFFYFNYIIKCTVKITTKLYKHLHRHIFVMPHF